MLPEREGTDTVMAHGLSPIMAFLTIATTALLLLASTAAGDVTTDTEIFTETFFESSTIPIRTVVVSLTRTESLLQTTPTGNTILRPSAGETVTAGAPYTVIWTDPVGTDVQFNVEDTVGNAIIWGSVCDGYLQNAFCGKLSNATANTGSWVWNVPFPPSGGFNVGSGWNAYLQKHPQTFWLVLNVVTEQDPVWQPTSPYQDSHNFSIVLPASVASTLVSSSQGINAISGSSTLTSETLTSGFAATGKSGASTPVPASAGTAGTVAVTSVRVPSTGTQGSATATKTNAASLKRSAKALSIWITITVLFLENLP